MRCTKLFTRFVIAVALFSVTATSVDAGWNEFWAAIGQGYRRNNAWPEPFQELDAIQVITPFEIQKNNGWKLNNTIGAEKFRLADSELQPSGRESLRWIATQAPANRRVVHVLRGRTQVETDARVASVEKALGQYAFNGSTPTVSVTDRLPPSYSGAWATKINRAWLEELAAPVLPSQTSQGSNSVTQ